MNFAVMRMQRRKTVQSVGKAAAHNLRTAPCKNADPDKTGSNRVIVGPADAAGLLAEHKARTAGIKRKSDTVQGGEMMLTASPEWFEKNPMKLDEWVKQSMKWATGNLGGPGNVLSAVLHLDEKTPHLHILFVPLVGGKFNAKKLFGTQRKYIERQTSYAAAMAPLGLVRGVKNSKADHQTVRQFYSRANAAAAQIEPPTLAERNKAAMFSGETRDKVEAYDRRTERWRAKAGITDTEHKRRKALQGAAVQAQAAAADSDRERQQAEYRAEQAEALAARVVADNKTIVAAAANLGVKPEDLQAECATVKAKGKNWRDQFRARATEQTTTKAIPPAPMTSPGSIWRPRPPRPH